MANIPLKTIKFPGLDDTYTVPQVDNTLSVTGAAADAKKTGDELTELNERLNNVKSDLDVQVIEGLVFEQGNISSSGAEGSDSSRIRTKYLACPLGFSFTVPNGYKTYIYGFAKQEQSSIIGPIYAVWKTGEINTVEFNGKYIRILLAKTDNTALTPSSVPTISITRNTTTDKTLSIQDVSADAKETGSKFDEISSSVGANGSMSILFKHGSIGSNGLNSDYNKESRVCTGVLEFDADLVFSAKDSTQDNAFNVAYYNADDSFNSFSGWIKSVTIPKNSKFRIIASLTPTVNTAESISTILSAFKYSFKFKYDNEELPNYYFENGYIEDKIETLQSYYSLSAKLVMFGFITDTHVNVNAGKAFNIMKYLDDNSNSVPFVVFGGDIVGHTTSIDDVYEQTTQWINMMSPYGKRLVLHCRGNHDLLGDQSDSYLDRKARFNYLMRNQQMVIPSSNNFYYFYDVPFTDTRIIVVDDFDGAVNGGASKFTQTQIDWILGTALNASNKNIVFITHIPADSTMSYYEANMSPLQIIMGALKQKTNLNTTSDGLNLVHDFANTTNTLVCCFCGHGHNDEYHTDSNGVLTIMTNCDGNASSSSAGYDRTVGTVNEQCFDVVSIDTDNKDIYLTRIGAGSDRQFSYS